MKMNRRNHLRMLAGMLCGAITLPTGLFAQDDPKRAEESAIIRRVRYSLIAQNQTGHVLEQRAFVHAPVRQTSTQRGDALSCTQPSFVEVYVFGNQTLRLEMEPLAPYAARIVTIDAQLSVNGTPQPQAIPPMLEHTYRAPERYMESVDPTIQALVPLLKSQSARQTAKAVFEFVRRSLRKEEYAGRDRGAVSALREHLGGCADHAYLFTALMRASGFPARVVNGYIDGYSAVLLAHDFHTWAEFHDEGAWLLADAHQGRFMREAARYIAMRVVSHRVPTALGANQRFAAAGAGLLLTMN